MNRHRIQRAAAVRVTAGRAQIRSVRNIAGWERDQRIPLPGRLRPDRLPVIICTWRRLGRLERTLTMLAAQDTPVQAIIWNNSHERAVVDAVVAAAAVPVIVHHSPRNIGGFGRFYLAREMAQAGHDTVVFIDDDQEFGPATISDLLSAHRARSLSGWWAFRYRSADYSSRFRAAPGEHATYTGTGGMIADTAVFRDPRLFRCPRRYWFIEDIWLCYVAGYLCGYDLFRSPADFEFESAQDEHALYRTVGRAKWAFHRYLIRRGWDPAGP